MATIIYLHPHFTIEGGAGRYVLETATRLVRRGYRVKVLSTKAAPEIVSDAKASVEFVDLGGSISSRLGFWLRFPFTVKKILKIVDSEPEALLFAQVFPANWWGFLIKWLRPKRKMVWMCQEPSAFIHSPVWINALAPGLMKSLVRLLNPLLKRIDISLSKYVDLVFANSHFSKQSIHDVYGYPDDHVKVTYLGADHKVFTAGSIERSMSVITIGRLTKFKNVDLIIHAVGKLRDQGLSNLVLHIVGKGEAEEELKQLSQNLGLREAVHFHGAVSTQKLVRLLQEARVFVLASIGEPFGLVAVEAMACGTPVIVAENGGPSETVQQGESGFLINPLHEESLQNSLKEILTDDSLFRSLSVNATNRARLFDWDQTVDRSVLLWKDLIA